MSWRYIEQRTVKARKDHWCLLCMEAIPRGTQYARRTGINEDGPVTMHMHIECEAATAEWGVEEWETFECGEFERPAMVCPGEGCGG